MLLKKYGKSLKLMSNIEIEQIKDKIYWDCSIDKSVNSSLFSKTLFLDLWFKEYELFEIKYKKKSLAYLVYGIKNFVNKVNSFSYQNLIYTDEFQKLDNHSKYKKNLDIINFFLEKFLKNREMHFSLHYLIEDIRPFLWYNYNQPDKKKFKLDLKYTAILNLKNIQFEDILNSCRSVRKQEFNKFAKNDLKISYSKDIEILDYLHVKTFERQDQERKLSEKLFINNVAKKLIEEDKAELMVCKKNDEYISSIVVAYDKLDSYYLISANDPKFRDLGGNTALLFHHLKNLLKKKFLSFDFLGVNSPNRGDFKLSFNPEIKKYYNLKI